MTYWLIAGVWVVCAPLSVWLMTKIQDRIVLGELVSAILFGPVTLFCVCWNQDLVIWRKKQ